MNALARYRRFYRQASFLLLSVLLAGSCRLLSDSGRKETVPADDIPPAESGYELAEELFAAGRYDDALRILDATAGGSGSPPPPEFFLLKGKVAAAQGRAHRARYFLRNLSGYPAFAPAVAEGLVLLADLCYQDRLTASAFDYYLEAVNRFAPNLSAREASRLHLRLALIALFDRQDRRLAGNYLLKAAPELLNGEDYEHYARVRKQLAWQVLSAERLGVQDGNISALEIDGDDLWIGTWNGGVIRYSLASEEIRIFRRGKLSLDANTVRCIKAFAGRIWVGSYRGLYSYSRAGGTWSEEPRFGGAEPIRVEVLEEAAGTLYAGTLGRGLWRFRDGRWEQLPFLSDAFVNALCAFGPELAVGTMKRGLLFFDPAGGGIISFDTLHPGLEAGNITLLLPESRSSLWIGTYGRGLYHWLPESGRLIHYSRSSGGIPDDWVLSGALGGNGIYFGTFGGGVIHFFGPDNRSRIIGLRDGLPSLDVSVIRTSPPFLFFGMLGAGVAIHYVHPEP